MRKGTLYGSVALVLALSGAGLVANKLWTKSLTEQASKTQAALTAAAQFRSIAVAEKTRAEFEHAAALKSEQRAARAEARALALADHADSIAAWAPDTCRPYIAAQVEARDELQHALNEQKETTGHLMAAAQSDSLAIAALLTGLGTATDAAQDLVNSTHRSFFLRILPKVGIGATAGINPQGKFDTVVGPTLVWTF